jgi:hypothetical protein
LVSKSCRCLVVDEQVLAVVVAVGLGERRVVRVAPGDVPAVDATLVEHRLGLLVEAVGLPGLGGEDGDVLEDAHGWDAVDDDHAALPAGREGDELVPLACRYIGLGGGQHVLLGQTPSLEHLLQVLGGGERRCQEQSHHASADGQAAPEMNDNASTGNHVVLLGPGHS